MVFPFLTVWKTSTTSKCPNKMANIIIGSGVILVDKHKHHYWRTMINYKDIPEVNKVINTPVVSLPAQMKEKKSKGLKPTENGYKITKKSVWNVTRLVDGLCQLLEIMCLEALTKKETRNSSRELLWQGVMLIVTPKMFGSTLRKPSVFSSKEYLLAATWLQWLKQVSHLSTLSKTQ